MPIVSLQDVHKSFGPEVVFDGLSLRVYANEKVGMVGANGSGKTTLLRLVLGDVLPDIGNIGKRKGLRIGYLAQESEFDGQRTVIEEMHAGVEGILNLQRKMERAGGNLGELAGDELKIAMGDYDWLSAEFELAGETTEFA